MNPPSHEFHNRRAEDLRISILEKQYEAIKESQASVHKRITEVKKEVAEEVRAGLSAIFAKIEASEIKAQDREDKKRVECDEHKTKCDEVRQDVSVLKNECRWIYNWVLAGWTAILGLGSITLWGKK